MTRNDNFYEECVSSFHQITKKPFQFLDPNEDLCNNIKENMKLMYDLIKSEEVNTIKSNALPKLITKDFDLEQMWQQIELQNNSVVEHFLTAVSKLIIGKNGLLFKNLAKETATAAESREKSNDLDRNSDEADFSDIESEDERPTGEPTGNVKKSIVDDEFFKLDEMERFLQAEEKKMNDPDSGNDSDDSESDATVDLFEAGSEDEGDAKCARFKDFFLSKEPEKKKESRNKFLEEFEDDDDGEEEEPKSSFELRQDRLDKKITEIEDEALQAKPWQLKGEITAENRPSNSLLQEVVEFDLTTRPMPVMTEQTTMQLEDIIKQRIKDRTFDSVERKVKPMETPLEYKKKLVLNQEKSKESLAQIYEREFIEQQAALDPEEKDREEKEPELHQEIKCMMKNLFVKLDALSNFHFTPKPAVPELKIISNLPAISMEEVAPVATSDATLLAPEEVKGKPKSDTLGKSERTATDKKRERRKKKLKQKMHAKKKEKMETNPGLGNKYSKEKAKKTLDKIVKNKNVDKMDESFGVGGIKSSKAFFSQLEEQVKTQIKRKPSAKSPKMDGKIPNAKRLKL